jgi:ABC-type branched-subunit amino acid transport system substrate-binding protein
MFYSRKISRLAVALAAVLVVASAVGALAAPSGPPIRIGGTLALTGPLAATALLHKITAEIYVEELNRGTGLLGRSVEWILLDDQSKPEVTRSLYEKLITVDKVDLLLGPYATGGIIAAMGVAQRLDHTPRRHYHLFPAPGPMVVAPEANLALSNTFFEEHPPFTSNPAAARFATLYHERAAKAGVPYTNVDTQAAGSYTAWQMLEAAVTATKSLDDKVLAQWLRKNQVQTIVGRFRFDGPNNYGDDLSKVKQVQDGKWVVVWPKEFAAPGARLLPP